MPGIVVPTEPAANRSVYHLYVIRSDDRDGLAGDLRAAGIHTGFHYPLPLHLQRCYRPWGYQVGSLPVTERVGREVLSLPMFPGITPEQQQRTGAAIHGFRPEAYAAIRRNTAV
jgi:dTDP-4-amino-4,6-dideoxygalactose transaminase